MLKNRGSLTMGLVFALGFAVIGSCSGCNGEAADPNLVQITGSVKKKDGTPIPGANVTFTLKVGEGKPATGTTDDQGNYFLSTFMSVSKTDRGVLPGEYNVTISKVTSSNPMGNMSGKEGELNKMSEEDRKKFMQGVQDKMPGNTADKEKIGDKGPMDAKKNEENAKKMSSELSSNAIPAKYSSTATSGLSAKVEEGNTNPIDFVIDDQ